MHEALAIALLETITRFYLGENRFSGIPVVSLTDRLGASLDAVRAALTPLIRAQLVSLEFGDRCPDPYTRALQDAPVWYQLDRLRASTREVGNLEVASAFPSQRHLERVVNVRFYAATPYTLRLALGAPRYHIETFHPSILDFYDDRQFALPFASESFLERHAGAIAGTPQRKPAYGVAYDEQFNRAVAACLGDLAGLSSGIQQLWQSKTIAGTFRVHPDYEQTLFGDAFRNRMSIYRALREELLTINRCCTYLRRPVLFPHCRRDSRFLDGMSMISRPSINTTITFLTRLQTLTIQNLDPAFIGNDAVDEAAFVGPYSRMVTTPATRLERLENWMNRHLSDGHRPFTPYLDVVRAARRRLHHIQHVYQGDGWEETMQVLQKKVVRAAYTSFRDARKLFESQIGTDLHMPQAVRDERVWAY